MGTPKLATVIRSALQQVGWLSPTKPSTMILMGTLYHVSQTQLQGKNDVILEFHVDDTTKANEKDSLMEMSFHIPNSNTQYVGDVNHPPTQVFHEKIMSMAEVGGGGEEAVVTFEGIAILTQPHTFVIATLDPPIRKGQTLYPHIVLNFETNYVVQSDLSLGEELLNTKYKDKLELSYKVGNHFLPNMGRRFYCILDFHHILCGLSGAKVTKSGKFRSCQDGYAVKSSLKTKDGVLYPLEKSFFFLPKLPTLILHEEIDYVEFERHAAGESNMHYFNLLIGLETEQELLFRNIQRNEYHNLFDFIGGKGLKIMNLGDMRTTNGVAYVLQDEDDDVVDPHLVHVKNEAGGYESDEDDEDFVLDKDDEGSPTDDSGEGESDASDIKKVLKREPSTSKPFSSKKKSKYRDEDGSKKKKQKKKKDPNAPKMTMSGFMFLSQMERDYVKKTNPGIAFTEVARVLGDKWKKMSDHRKDPCGCKVISKRLRNKRRCYRNRESMARWWL
ncbi:hypothetical protein UlMin_000464 [Ulmus minor]